MRGTVGIIAGQREKRPLHWAQPTEKIFKFSGFGSANQKIKKGRNRFRPLSFISLQGTARRALLELISIDVRVRSGPPKEGSLLRSPGVLVARLPGAGTHSQEPIQLKSHRLHLHPLRLSGAFALR